MSIFIWYGYEASLVERARRLAEKDFLKLSLWWEEEEGRSPLVNLRNLRSLGHRIDQVHLPYFRGGLWQEDPEDYVQAFLASLEELSKGEVPLAVFHPTMMGEEGLPVGDRGLEAFERIFTRARELGIELAGENLREDRHLLALLDNFDISLCLDTGHLGVSGNYEELRGYFKRTSCLHLHDNDGKRDMHLIPGDGVLPLADWLGELPQGLDYHLEINRGLSNFYQKTKEEDFLKRARRSLEELGEKNEG